QARDGMKEQFDMEYLKPMKYNNTYTVSVKEEFAEENDLETMGDLKEVEDRKSTRLNSSHVSISYAVFCLKKKKEINTEIMVTEAKQCNLQKHTASPLDKVEREEPTISDTITHQPTQHTVVNI